MLTLVFVPGQVRSLSWSMYLVVEVCLEEHPNMVYIKNLNHCTNHFWAVHGAEHDPVVTEPEEWK